MTTVPLRSQPRSALVACFAASVVAHGAAVFVASGGLGPRVRAFPAPVGRGALAGETFEIPTEEVPDDAVALGESPSSGSARAGAAASSAPSPADRPGPEPASGRAAALQAPSRARQAPGSSTVSSDAARNEGGGAAGGGNHLVFGALGDRSATPLAAAFTRGFPQAASADPLWMTAAFGSAGAVDVELTLDEQGALVSARRSGGDPSPALAEALRRTLALIRARAFTAEGRVTRLRVSATVTPDEVHDGLHGEVFAIGGSFEGEEGSAFFALAIGRRVDIRVRALR